MSKPSPDFDQPIAILLRDGTAAAHEAAENSAGAGYLTRGELAKEEYTRFLIMLYHIYATLEQAIEQHATHPALAPTYNPTLLARAPALQADIAHLLDVPVSALPLHPLWASMVSSPPAGLARYTARLRDVRDAPSPAPLLAHGYVRYLGDLSGGQFIRRRVEKAYGLESDKGAGTSFYEFSKLGDPTASATLGDMKRIKEWYRDGMNSGVGDDRELKALVLAEANTAFELNNGLFAELKPPSDLPTPPRSPVHSLGDPMSPVEPTAGDSYNYPLQTAKLADEIETERSAGTFTTHGVLSFIFAMCLAHFILVVGGFTGSRGWDKYVAVLEWIGKTRAQVLGL